MYLLYYISITALDFNLNKNHKKRITAEMKCII